MGLVNSSNSYLLGVYSLLLSWLCFGCGDPGTNKKETRSLLSWREHSSWGDDSIHVSIFKEEDKGLDLSLPLRHVTSQLCGLGQVIQLL